MMSLQRHQQEAGFEIVTAEPRKALLPESSFMEGRGHLVENASVSPSEISSACTKACSGYVQVFKDGRGHVGGFGGTQCQARDRTAVSKLPRERRLLATAVELEDSEQNMERGRPPQQQRHVGRTRAETMGRGPSSSGEAAVPQLRLQ
ncbi:unnamed protein product [Lampetra fluviatilis]